MPLGILKIAYSVVMKRKSRCSPHYECRASLALSADRIGTRGWVSMTLMLLLIMFGTCNCCICFPEKRIGFLGFDRRLFSLGGERWRSDFFSSKSSNGTCVTLFTCGLVVVVTSFGLKSHTETHPNVTLFPLRLFLGPLMDFDRSSSRLLSSSKSKRHARISPLSERLELTLSSSLSSNTDCANSRKKPSFELYVSPNELLLPRRRVVSFITLVLFVWEIFMRSRSWCWFRFMKHMKTVVASVPRCAIFSLER